MAAVRCWLLYMIRGCGGFALAKYLTRKQLRILCYHGFSLGDEHQVAPIVFMRAATFERRMQILRKRRIRVITLDEAVTRLPRGEITEAETVITMDDGWASNLSIGLPILDKFRYPACVYVTTEHLAAGTEVFNVALYYMIRTSGRDRLTLRGLHPQLDGSYDIRSDPDAAHVALARAAERAAPLATRQRWLLPIAAALGLDLEKVLANGRFRLLSREELRQLSDRGIDIEMHTHTHHLPDSDFEAMTQEVVRNRAALAEISGTTPRHFCYPGGKYTRQHPEWLRSVGVVSATTCDTGLNDATTSLMLLRRFLDADNASDIEFEAEICGAREVARRLRAAVARLLGAAAIPPATAH